MPEVGEVKYKVTADDSGIDEQINKSENKLKSGFGKAASVVGKAVTGALVAGTAAVGAFAKSAVDAGMSFDSSMSQVAATMGKTVDEIGDLRDFAQQMGATTAFSATQAADALNYMALAGYDAETSMTMLPNVLNLAAAGGMELATASDMVTDASSALGLTLDETAAMVDQMAKTSSVSNTSVQQLGEAMLTVGGTAKMLQGGTVELSQALGILADNGVKGSEGGTALRNIILSLSAPTKKAAAQMEDLGIQVFDAAGEMLSLEDIMGQFNDAMADMSSGEKTEALNKIFNKVDLKSVNALMDTNVQRWDDLTAAIENSQGAAQAMADTQLDNLAGDITLFQSALEGAKIAVSDGLTPSLRDFVQFGTDGLTRVTEAFNTGGVAGAMEELGGILSDGISMIADKAPAMIDAGLRLIEALANGLLKNIDKITKSALEIGMTIIRKLIAPETLRGILDAAMTIISELATGIGQALPELIPAAYEAILSLVEDLLDNIDMIIDAGIELIIGLAFGLVDAIPKILDKVPVIISKLVEALIRNAPKLLAAAVQLIIALAQGLIQYIPRLITAIPQIIAALVSGFIAGVQDIMRVGSDLVSGLWQGIQNAWGRLVESAKNLGKGLVDTFKSVLRISSPSGIMRDEVGKWIPEGVAEGIEENADSVDDSINDLVDDTMQTVARTLNTSAGIDYNLPDISGYAASMSAALTAQASTSIEIPLYLDGREIARGSAWYMSEQLAWEAR